MELFGMKWKTNGIYFELFLAQSTKCRPQQTTHKAIPFHSLRMDGMDCFVCLRSGGGPRERFTESIVEWIAFLSLVFGWIMGCCGSQCSAQRRQAAREEKQWMEQLMKWCVSRGGLLAISLSAAEGERGRAAKEAMGQQAKQQTQSNSMKLNWIWWFVVAAAGLLLTPFRSNHQLNEIQWRWIEFHGCWWAPFQDYLNYYWILKK